MILEFVRINKIGKKRTAGDGGENVISIVYFSQLSPL